MKVVVVGAGTIVGLFVLAIVTALLISAGTKHVSACWSASSARIMPFNRGRSAIFPSVSLRARVIPDSPLRDDPE